MPDGEGAALVDEELEAAERGRVGRVEGAVVDAILVVGAGRRVVLGREVAAVLRQPDVGLGEGEAGLRRLPVRVIDERADLDGRGRRLLEELHQGRLLR